MTNVARSIGRHGPQRPSVARTGRNGVRPASDFYPTPPAATRALVAAEAAEMPDAIWEPAAGDGALGFTLMETGLCDVIMTELRPTRRRGGVDRSARIQGGRDFLTETRLLAPGIVTNPPYRIADDFVRHALGLRPAYAAFFLPLTFLAGKARGDLIEGRVAGLSLARVLVFRERVTLYPKGVKATNAGTVSYAWFVWTNDRKLPPAIFRVSPLPWLAAARRARELLPRPGPAGDGRSRPGPARDERRSRAPAALLKAEIEGAPV